jgi:N-acyl-D-amino-acid deacylase
MALSLTHVVQIASGRMLELSKIASPLPMTGLPAMRIGLKKSGLLKPGHFADITIFNSDTVIDKATYIDPRQYAEGIEYVWLNGIQVIERGRHTHCLQGIVLVR